MIELHDCEQGTPEWFALRCGVPTASEFKAVLAQDRRGKTDGKTRTTYLYRLAGEVITGESAETFSNAHTERGKAMEEQAREAYEFLTDQETDRIGFAYHTLYKAGASPDSFIGQNGTLEIKTKLPQILCDVIMSKELPPEHKAQVQGQLMITEREWCDFVAYWPKMPPFVTRVYRDEGYIRMLAAQVSRFNEDLRACVEKLRAYRCTVNSSKR